jgi:3-hydroxyisobutyrate dehydrogenase
MSKDLSMRYAYIGLGHLGGKLAACLRRAGFSLVVHDRDVAAAEPMLALGARWAETPRAAAEAVDAVITCLPSPAVTEAVLTGPDGVLAGLRPGGTWIEMSTLDRDSVLRLAHLAAAREVATLEAPVTGGVHLAATGAVTVLAGGDSAVFSLHEPALRAMGRQILHMGPLGSAAVMKVITNMLAFIHVVAAGEALMLAKRGGLDLGQAFHAIKGSSGTSFVHETESQLILNGSYDIAFTMDLACKDLGFAMGLGRDYGVPLDLAALTAQTFIRARETFGGGAWSTMVVKLLEDALHTDLRAPGFPARLEAARSESQDA